MNSEKSGTDEEDKHNLKISRKPRKFKDKCGSHCPTHSVCRKYDLKSESQNFWDEIKYGLEPRDTFHEMEILPSTHEVLV